MHIACAEEIQHRLLPALKHLHTALAARSPAGPTLSKSAAPYQDGHADHFGPGISGYATQIPNGIARIEQACPS